MIDWFNNNDGFMIVVLTAALVLATGYYAWEARRARKAAERAQFGAHLVIISGGRSSSSGGKSATFHAVNIGPGPAYRVMARIFRGEWSSDGNNGSVYPAIAGTAVPKNIAGTTSAQFTFGLPDEEYDRWPEDVIVRVYYSDRFGHHVAEHRPAGEDPQGPFVL